MWLPAEVIAPPVSSWCSLDDAKVYLRADGSAEEDPQIQSMIDAAGSHVENMTGQRLMAQTVRISCSSFADLARLPVAPVKAVNAVTGLAASGERVALDPAHYRLGGAPVYASVLPVGGRSWPAIVAADDAVQVELVVGYDSADAIPPALRHACYLLLGDYYDNREDSSVRALHSIPHGVMALLANYRIWI